MEELIYRGRAWKYQDNVSTDHILPSRFMTQVEPKELASHCMAGIDPSFAQGVRSGDLLVAGYNLGYGSSREQAPWALKHSGVKAVIARSFARIFFRNCFNIGLPAISCPEFVEEASRMDEVELNLPEGTIRNLSLGKTYTFIRPPEFLLEYVKLGGLIPYLSGTRDGKAPSIMQSARRLP